MDDTRALENNCGNADNGAGQGEAVNAAIEQSEERNLDHALQAEEEQLESERKTIARNEQQDLNQGMDSGTHDSVRHGVKWGAAYQMGVAPINKGQKKDEPNKQSE
jgi:hypothetical protein